MPPLDVPSPAPAATADNLVFVAAPAELDALRPEWSALEAQCSVEANPFTSAEWLLPWWRHLGGGELRAAVLRSAAGNLVGLAPFFVGDDPANGGRRTLWLLGSGVSDYAGVLVHPDYEFIFAALLASALVAMRDVECIDWQQVRPASPLLAVARDLGTPVEISPQEPCPVVALTPVAAAERTAGFRHKLDYEERRLGRLGRVSYERAGAGNLDELFAVFVRLHGARWAAAGGGVLAAERLRAFHAEVAAGMLARDRLRLLVLRVDGAIVAAYYGFHLWQRAYYYLGGFDPAWRRHGVGNRIVDHAMRVAVAEGARTFDFLRGREPYKYQWGARDEPTYRIRARLEHA